MGDGDVHDISTFELKALVRSRFIRGQVYTLDMAHFFSLSK
jgi:hypothetical protein